MAKRTTRRTQANERDLALLKSVQSLVDKLIDEDHRLKAASKRAQYSSVGDDGIGEETLKIYRQRLRE